MLDFDQAADGFAAAGSRHRLEVLRHLVRAGPMGLPVGEIQDRTGMPASTLAHHLRHLTDSGLVSQLRQGRTVYNRANFDHIEDLASFLLRECCADLEPDQDLNCKPPNTGG